MNRTTRTARLNRSLLAIGVLLVALLASGCNSAAETPATQPATSTTPASGPSPEPTANFPATITDDAGRKVTVEKVPERIVSLAPANTELLFALGLGDRVVGVTSYDDYPPEVADIAKVGDFAGPNLEAIAAADPDLVLVTLGVQEDMVAKLEDLGATVVAIDPSSVAGLFNDFRKVGAVTGTPAHAEQLLMTLQSDISKVRKAVADLKPVTTFIEIGQNPLFTVGQGTLLNELVGLAGGENVVTEEGYVPYSSEQVVKADPDVYLATHSSATDTETVAARAGYKDLSAVKNGRVVILDDNLTSRPGPRIADGLKLIAEGLHPEAFGQ
jgi:iron complex transport system substrate-binding protein